MNISNFLEELVDVRIQNQDNGTTAGGSPTYVLTVHFILMVVLSVIGNSILIIAIATQPKLRRPANVYIAGLAVTDLCFAVCHLIAIDSTIKGKWRMGDLFCYLNALAIQGLAIYSLAHLMVIAFHRYLYVCKHTKAAVLFTWKATWIIEGLTNLTATIIAIPGIFIGDFGYDDRVNMCTILSHEPGQWQYPAYLLANLIILPCSVSILSYYKIYCYVKKIKQKVMENQYFSSERKSQMVRHQLQQLISRFFVFLVFLITFIPYLIAKILDSFMHVPDQVHVALLVLLSSNSMINPIIYGALNTTFREGYTRILRVPKCCQRNKVHQLEGHAQTSKKATTNGTQPKVDDIDSILNCGIVEDETNN